MLTHITLTRFIPSCRKVCENQFIKTSKKYIYIYTYRRSDFEKKKNTEEILQFHDQICSQSQTQEAITNPNNKSTYLGYLRKNFEPSSLHPRLTCSTKG